MHWIAETQARVIVRQARRDAGRSPDTVMAGRALAQAAADHRQTLTPHDVAMTRVGSAADRIDSHLKAMMKNGTLREFNRAFKRRPSEAATKGQGIARRHNLYCRILTSSIR